MKKVLIETYGCTLNRADSDMMGTIIEDNGFEVKHGRLGKESECDYVVVNTCTVKKPTEQKIIERLRLMNGMGKRLIVTGCMASANADIIKSVAPGASIVTTGNVAHIHDAINNIENGRDGSFASHGRGDKPLGGTTVDGAISRIPVSEGCLSNCTFCETKFARGPLNSFSEALIVKAVEMNVGNGAKEIELTSQDMGAYGLDRKTNIAGLLGRITDIEGDFKVRVGMLNPEHLGKYIDMLIDAYKSDKVYKFIHLPVQSGSNKVLRDMKRNYTIEEFDAHVAEIRSRIKDISIATDMIVGYPTEAEADHQRSLEFIQRTRPSVTNVSKFSMRHHAPASRLRQLGNMAIKRRTMEMMRTARAVQYSDMQMLAGKIEKVLITEANSKSLVGRDDSYRNVAVSYGEGLKIGDAAEVRVTGNSSVCLFGTALLSRAYN